MRRMFIAVAAVLAVSGPVTPSSAASAPSSDQLVGFHHVAIVVPRTFARFGGDCAPTGRDAVYYYPEDGVGALCPIGTDTTVATTTVGMGPLSKASSKLTGRLRPSTPVDGHAVTASSARCTSAVCTQVFAVPDENAFFAVQAKGPGRTDALTRVRDSIVAVGDEESVVPFSPYSTVAARKAAAVRAGLRVSVRKEYLPLTHAGRLVSESPRIGSVVRRGSGLRLTIPGASYPATSGSAARRARLIATYVANAEVPMIEGPASDLSAFYRVVKGNVAYPNLGYRCAEGTLVRVVVTGDFGVTHGRRVTDSGSSIIMLTNPATGNVCLLSVSTSRSTPGASDTEVPLQ